ncbi:MAG TPA: phosphomannomutase/phosphoglucomutase [Acidimicrobiales bacterium]|jgi:phosphomannomutase|nr:phosphomannomutase/phosphoglucomutase [Acidimicrobiales bacterium]
MASLDTIFKAYDIRGVVPDELDATTARQIGRAFAIFTGADRVLVAWDMRRSSEDLSAAFIAGVREQGTDVVALGLTSTDLIYFAAGRLDAPGAMFTASHNPAQYGGIKLCLAGARPVGQDTGLQEIKRMVAEGGMVPAAHPGTATERDLLDDYADHVRSFVDVNSLRPLKVVADTGNGMGGLVVPRVFDGLPFELEELYPELDGTFPNHPADPMRPENLKDLQGQVLETAADVGLAFDGDADRVVLMDETAEPLSGSTTTAMLAASILDKTGAGNIIANVIAYPAVRQIIAEHGGTAIRSRVGHSFIKAEMAKYDAIFGGEHSAHYYFRDNYRADSGLIAAVLVLEIVSKANKPLSQLRGEFERYAASGEINTTVDDQQAVIERVAAAFSDGEQDRLDGLTVDLGLESGGWWFNVRPSNTEPLLRLNLLAPTPAEVDKRVADVVAVMKGET